MHRHLFRLSVILSLITLVLGAVLFAGVRILLPEMERYRADAEAWLTLTLDRPVRIHGLNLAWEGWEPVLEVNGVELMDSEGTETRFRLKRITVSLDPWASIKAQAIKPDRLDIEGVSLWVHRYEDGRLTIAGIDAGLPETREENAEFWLLPPGTVSLTNANLVLQDDIIRPGKPPIHIHNVDLLLNNQDRNYRLQIDGRLGIGIGDRVSAIFELTGPPGYVGNLSGKAYVHIQDLIVSEWLQDQSPIGSAIKQATVDLQIWSDIKGSKLINARGDLALKQLNLRDLPALEGIQANIVWRRETEGWSMDLSGLSLDHTSLTGLDSDIALRWLPDQGSRQKGRLYGMFDDFTIDELLPFFAGAPDFPPLLQGLEMHALLESGHFMVDTRQDQTQFNAWLTIDDLTLSAKDNIPGFKGLDAEVFVSNHGGLFRLKGTDMDLRFPGLFRDPLPMGQLEGTMSLTRYGDTDTPEHQRGWQIYSPHLDMQNRDVEADATVTLRLPDSGAMPHMDLLGTFHDGDGSQVSTYLPAGIMPEDAVAWLDQGIVNGDVTSGALLYRGALDGMPFKDHSGRLEIRFNVENGIVDYQPGWPRIEEISTQVGFINTRLEIDAVAGKIFDADLTRVEATVPDLMNANLHISGTGRGPGSEMLRFLMESPLHDDFGVYFKGLDLAGNTDLDLSLQIPLDSSEDLSVDGRVHFSNNRLKETNLNIVIADLTGDLRFDSFGLYSKNLRGTLDGRPLKGSVQTNPQGTVTEVRLTINDSLEHLASDYVDSLSPYAEGKSDFEILLGFQRLQEGDSQPDTTLNISSDLVGTKIMLPQPFSKPANTRRTLRFETIVGLDKPAPLRIRYDDLADLVLELKEDKGQIKVRGGELRLGGEPATLPGRDGIRILGKLDKLDLEQVLALTKDQQNKPDRDTTTGNTQAPPPLITEVDVEIGELKSGQLKFHDLRLSANRNTSAGQPGWDLSLDSQEAVGVISVPDTQDDKTPLLVRLDRLHVNIPEENTTPSTSKTPETAPPSDQTDPRNVPPLNVSIADFQINDMKLGRLELQTAPTKRGLRLTKAEIRSDSTHGQATGDWRVDGTRQMSRINITLESTDLDTSLSDLGFAHVISGDEGKIQLKGGWLGAPMDFDLKAIEGNLDLKFAKGRLLDVNPGPGRVFGLFSITSLPRRLKLDFSDLFKKGFSFDVISGSFTLTEGDAYTSDLTIQGPPARVDISGRTGFSNRDYDQNVVVTPDVSSTVAAASALAINPAVGAAVFLVQKLLKDPLDKLTQFHYEVRGPWADPSINKITPPGAETPQEESDPLDVWNSDS